MRAHDIVPVVKAQLRAMQDRTTVIRAGRLIDGTTANSVRRDLAIFVDSGTITRVATAPELPPDAEVIDLSNSTVLPGTD